MFSLLQDTLIQEFLYNYLIDKFLLSQEKVNDAISNLLEVLRNYILCNSADQESKMTPIPFFFPLFEESNMRSSPGSLSLVQSSVAQILKWFKPT